MPAVSLIIINGGHHGMVVKESDFHAGGRGFDSRTVVPLGKV